MSDNPKEDKEIMRSVSSEIAAATISDDIAYDIYRKLVKKCIEDLNEKDNKEGKDIKEERDLDLRL